MADSDRTLIVLMDGRRLATVTTTGDRLALIYDQRWQETALSLSMPVAGREYGDPPVRAFLWGLLPDNERVLERWAREYGVSARNPFALLRHVGEDCAGAAQFVRPERVEAIRTGEGRVEWLDENEIADRIRELRRDPTAWHAHDTGQFSLAGAQAKFALYRDPGTGRWGEPFGAMPTTHIFKPAISGLDDHDLNEHLCLAAARRLGVDAASSHIEAFGAERVAVVQRYDRLQNADGTIRRLHQEDICQALGLPPTTKYQNEGGPTPEQIIALYREHIETPWIAERTVHRFVDMLAFNWLIGGTDAHAKNYSVLLAGPQVRPAPMYDVASALVYDSMYRPKLAMAMRIGGEYRLEGIYGRHWRRFAEANRLDPDGTIARIDEMAVRAPEAFAGAAAGAAVTALDSALPGRLVARVSDRAKDCRTRLLT